MKAILKYRFHSSIIARKENCNSCLSFSCSQVECDEIIKEINNLRTNNATQIKDISKKIIKENSDIFRYFIFENYYNCFSYSIFPNTSKSGIKDQFIMKLQIRLKIIIDLQVYYQKNIKHIESNK